MNWYLRYNLTKKPDEDPNVYGRWNPKKQLDNPSKTLYYADAPHENNNW